MSDIATSNLAVSNDTPTSSATNDTPSNSANITTATNSANDTPSNSANMSDTPTNSTTSTPPTSADIPALFEANNIPALFAALELLSPPTTPPVTADSLPSNTLVAARIRPPSASELDASEPTAVRLTGTHHVRTRYLRRGVLGAPPSLEAAVFNVDTVFEADAETQDVYDKLVKSKLGFVRSGGTATLFAHGQTGSGKTHTMTGLQDLLAGELLGEEWQEEWKVGVSVVELAGSSAFDLFQNRAPVAIREDANRIVHYQGALELFTDSPDEMQSDLATAQSIRRTEETAKNLTSSRSHSICRFRLYRRDHESLPPLGAFYLVDLAGSEEARHTMAQGAQRLKETREINASLSTLQECIVAKAKADAGLAAHVPFRQSALTKALKHVFNPTSPTPCETVMLATVSPCLADVASSKNTLRYAQNCRGIVGRAKAQAYDAKVPNTWNNEQLRTWLVDNAGSLGVDETKVAPCETGSQLLAVITEDEFVRRCLLSEKGDKVDAEKAAAVYAKLWQMHVDSRALRPTEITERTSREPCEKTRAKPFHFRLRPGMFVEAYVEGTEGETEVVVVMAPGKPRTRLGAGAGAEAGAGAGTEAGATKMKPATMTRPARWLCAATKKSEGMGAGYEVNLWTQREVRVAAMKAEVVVVYDEPTRFYYIHLE